jgi:dTDP-4-dehydrorhamnose reductase
MKILVTGGYGQLGTALGEVLENHEVRLTDTDTMDITSSEQIEAVFAEFRPEVLVHGAAYTNVDGCEQNPDLAEAVNAQGTRNLAEACQKYGTAMVYISTDYVFDGTKKDPYLPDDEPSPISAYGRSKLEGERATATVPEHWILRTSWVFGEGKNFVQTMIGLAANHEVLTVVGDQVGRPTWAHDLALAIRDAIEKKPEHGIYHVTGDGPVVSWAGFARKIFEIKGLPTEVRAVTTADYFGGKEVGSYAPRPLYSMLDLEKSRQARLHLADWEESLRQYLS